MNPSLNLNNQFIFNSNFQSGNLDCVIKIHPNQFDLFLRIDSNTRGHAQWYYFSVKNPNNFNEQSENWKGQSKHGKIKLNICNLKKKSLLIHQGMKPFVFSKKKHAEKQVSWQQCAQNVTFQQKNLRYQIAYERSNVGSLFCLSFQYQFQYQNDQVFFAYCVPYTYNELQKDVKIWSKSKYVKVQFLGKSLSGLDLPLLHITNFQNNQKPKQNIVITARVHPAQSNSSYLLKGILSFLLNDCKQSQKLKDAANIYIVPMINPDGVVLGNSRTGVAGRDLNRVFNQNKKDLFPQVYLIKQLVQKLQKKQGVTMYLDLHGHSRKKNTFLYGPNYIISQTEYLKCRILPKIIQKIDSSFRYYSCSFNISEEKRTTARSVMLQNLGVPFTYTIQSSVGLYFDQTSMKTLNFTCRDWLNMGENVIRGVEIFISMIQEQQNISKQRKGLNKKQISPLKGSKAITQELITQRQNKFKRPSYFQLLQQIKATNNKKFQPESDSDDHDSSQQIPQNSIQALNKQIVKRKKANNKDFQQQNQMVSFTNQKYTIVQQAPPQLQIFSKSSIKLGLEEDFSLMGNANKTKTRSTIKKVLATSKNRQQKRQCQSQFSERKNILDKKYEKINFKQRYSVASNNIFPIQDRCEIVSLPKGLQTIKRQLKKGRNLIKNLQKNKLNFINIQSKIQDNTARRVRPKFSHPDFLKLRVGSSAGQIGRRSGNWDYSPLLQGYEIDNLAMTITTFKRK